MLTLIECVCARFESHKNHNITVCAHFNLMYDMKRFASWNCVCVCVCQLIVNHLKRKFKQFHKNRWQKTLNKQSEPFLCRSLPPWFVAFLLVVLVEAVEAV